MKKLCTSIFILTMLNLFGQGSNWKSLPVPFKSNVNIIKQSSTGVLLGYDTKRNGRLVSYNNGSTWEIFPFDKIYYASLDTDNFGNILYLDSKLEKMNLETKQIKSFAAPSNFSLERLYAPFQNSIILKSQNNVYFIKENGTILLFADPNISNIEILSSQTQEKIYMICKKNQEDLLYEITINGDFVFKNKWTSDNSKYYLEGKRIIRNTQYTDNEGVSWKQYNLPFNTPDSYHTYKGKLLLAQKNVLYLKNNDQNFSTINIPSSHTSFGLLASENLILVPNSNRGFDNIIFNDQTKTFNALEYKDAQLQINSIAFGNNESALVSDHAGRIFTTKDFVQWDTTGIQSYYGGYGSWGYNYPPFSFNKDNIPSITDRSNLYTSTNLKNWERQTFSDSIYSAPVSDKKIGTLFSNKNSIFKRRIGSSQWDKIADKKTNWQESRISNSLYLFKEFFGSEQVIRNDTSGNSEHLTDFTNFIYNFDLHYEMEYIYNMGYRYNVENRTSTYLMENSFDRGSTFNIVPNIDTSFYNFRYMQLLWTGHVLKLFRTKLCISNDYGRSFVNVPLELADNDEIEQIVISPDNYLYILTSQKGILKHVNPLPLANIIRLKLLKDVGEDCITANDNNGISGVQVNLEDQASQISDQNGNVVFYTFKKENKLKILDKAGILDLCDTEINVNFLSDNGLDTTIFISGTIEKECPNLALKFTTYTDSIRSVQRYSIVVTNNGNAKSDSTTLKIELDPYLSYSYYDSMKVTKIQDLVYSLKVKSLDPGESDIKSISTRTLVNVPIDRVLCTAISLDNLPNTCTSTSPQTICLPVDRSTKEKTIEVQFFKDLDGDCSFDSNESIIAPDIFIRTDNNDLSGRIGSSYFIQTGNDKSILNFCYDRDLIQLCQDTMHVIFPQNIIVKKVNVPIKSFKNCSKLTTTMFAGNFIRCFDQKSTFSIANVGNINSNAVNVRIELDPYLDVNSISHQPTSVQGNTYFFDFVGINSKSIIAIVFDLTVSCNSVLGYNHCSNITVEEEVNPCNLHQANREFCHINRGSYDPNDKTIYVNGHESKNLTNLNDQIEYKIRFQNTGTDTAYTVKIEDYISKKFDISSMRLIFSSHKCSWRVHNRLLQVIFDDIDLVDSLTNEPLSHGEIMFSIKLDTMTKVNDWITNKARIYFDRNDAIITNEVLSQFVKTSHIWDEITPKKLITISPNPGRSDISIVGLYTQNEYNINIYTTSGVLVKTEKMLGSQPTLNIESLIPGSYFIIAKDKKASYYGKFVKL